MRRTLIGIGICALLCGCDREDIHAYRAPKAVHIHNHEGEGTASNAKVAWTLMSMPEIRAMGYDHFMTISRRNGTNPTAA